MKRQRLLIVEDELALRLTLADRLKSKAYPLDVASDANEARSLVEGNQYDLILLDIMLPGEGGLEFCRHLRRTGFDAPILMLTARAEIADRVLGLKTGADDYLVKPFAMEELLARVEALLRRNHSDRKTQQSYRLGDIEIDLSRRSITRQGQLIELGEREFKLLSYLLINNNRAIGRDELLTEVWGYDTAPSSRTVDVHMAWLRSKLEPTPAEPRLLLTVRGLGYRAVVNESVNLNQG